LLVLPHIYYLERKRIMQKKKVKQSSIFPEPEIYGTATVGTKGQIVIPKSVREKYKIKTGDKVILFGSNAEVIAVVKADKVNELLKSISK
jgi:AbrB family looped-hinge helix DNA binding protein